MNFDFSCIYWLYVPVSLQSLQKSLNNGTLESQTTINLKALQNKFLLIPNDIFCLISTLQNDLSIAQNLAFFIKNALNLDICLFMNDAHADIDYFEKIGNANFSLERDGENIATKGQLPTYLITYLTEVDYQQWQAKDAIQKAFNLDFWAVLAAPKLSFYSFQLQNIPQYNNVATYSTQQFTLKGRENINDTNKVMDWDSIDLPF